MLDQTLINQSTLLFTSPEHSSQLIVVCLLLMALYFHVWNYVAGLRDDHSVQEANSYWILSEHCRFSSLSILFWHSRPQNIFSITYVCDVLYYCMIESRSTSLSFYASVKILVWKNRVMRIKCCFSFSIAKGSLFLENWKKIWFHSYRHICLLRMSAT